MSRNDEFYIGYESDMPPRTRRAVTTAVAIAIAIGLSAAAVFVGLQRGLAESRFEFGTVRTFEGYLALAPAPVLLVAESGTARPHWLVGPGKFGPDAALGGATAGWMVLSGTLIERDPWRMIEVVPGSVRPLASLKAAPLAANPPAVGVSLRGEIVDSKCFLGVMNPGERTVHRDCAVRCLGGGVPAMFAFQGETGTRLALLLGADARLRRDGVGRSITLAGVLSGPEEALVFTIDGGQHGRHR